VNVAALAARRLGLATATVRSLRNHPAGFWDGAQWRRRAGRVVLPLTRVVNSNASSVRPCLSRLLWAGVLVGLCGCQHSLSQYISPRVTGRVVDAQTHQPISNVQVRRVVNRPTTDSMEPLKGAQALKQKPAARSETDGTFVVTSQTELIFFRSFYWYSVTLAFERSGYERLVQSYSATSSTISPTGEPRVEAGDVALTPASRTLTRPFGHLSDRTLATPEASPRRVGEGGRRPGEGQVHG
jgi:hypothetical protein